MKKSLSALTIGLLLFSAEAGLAAQAKRKAAPAKPAATATLDQRVTLSTDSTPILGSPDAPVKLVEYMSYTCPHCAHFNEESHVELRTGMVRSGKVSVELRPFIRNEFDLIASLLVTCGSKDKWFGNNDAVFAAQATWFKEPSDPTYKQRWAALEANKTAQHRMVARDLGLYAVMQKRGYTPAQLDLCLGNQARGEQFKQMTEQAMAEGVNGTPSFKINGKRQSVYGWAPLKPLIEAALLPPPATI